MANLVRNETECLAKTWDALDEVVQSCRIEQLTTLGRDGWTIKDHLAHLALAERFVVAAFKGEPVQNVLATDRDTFLSSSDDELNEIGYPLYRSRTEGQVLELRERAHQDLMGTLARLNDDDLLQPFAPYGEPLGMTMLEVLRKNTTDHYETHRSWLEEIVSLETRGA